MVRALRISGRIGRAAAVAVLACGLPLAVSAQTVSPGTIAPSSATGPQVRVLRTGDVNVEQMRNNPRFASMPPAVATYALTLVVFEGSGWTDERVGAAAGEAALVLAQCGLRLRRLTLRQIDVPQAYQLLHTPSSRQVAAKLALQPPVIYFVRDTLNQPPFGIESFGRAYTRSRPELAGTVWVTAQLGDPGMEIARELAQLFGDFEQPSRVSGNLMNPQSSRGRHGLEPAQCARIVDSGVRDNWLIRLPQ